MPTDGLSLEGQGTADEVLYRVKSGKEATVYCCERPWAGGRRLVAAKVFKPLSERSFRNDAPYQQGRHIRDARLRRAYQNKSRAGRAVQFSQWVEHEWEMLAMLHEAGADVPEPYELSGDTIYMEFIGDREGPAPMLKEVRLEQGVARRAFSQTLGNVVCMLRHDIVHGDLSPYNILWWRNKAWVIDFPQAVRPIDNPNALSLLERDLSNVYDYFAPSGVRFSPSAYARQLWRAYLTNKL